MQENILNVIRNRGAFLIEKWNIEFLDRNIYWNKGPSKFFYEEILKMHQGKDIDTLLSERPFLKDVYAGLAVWGLDRLGIKGPKMKDFEDFEEQIRINRDAIINLSTNKLPCDLSPIKEKIKDLFLKLDLMETKQILVCNSKTLHFLVPTLFPIIDNEYITFFFRNQKNFGSKREDQAEFFLQIMEIYSALLNRYSIQGENPLKVIDNAIVKYIRNKNVPKT